MQALSVLGFVVLQTIFSKKMKFFYNLILAIF